MSEARDSVTERFEFDGPKFYRNLYEETPPAFKTTDSWFDTHRSGGSAIKRRLTDNSFLAADNTFHDAEERLSNEETPNKTPRSEFSTPSTAPRRGTPGRTPIRRFENGKGTPRANKENVPIPKYTPPATMKWVKGTPGKPRLIGTAAFKVTNAQEDQSQLHPTNITTTTTTTQKFSNNTNSSNQPPHREPESTTRRNVNNSFQMRTTTNTPRVQNNTSTRSEQQMEGGVVSAVAAGLQVGRQSSEDINEQISAGLEGLKLDSAEKAPRATREYHELEVEGRDEVGANGYQEWVNKVELGGYHEEGEGDGYCEMGDAEDAHVEVQQVAAAPVVKKPTVAVTPPWAKRSARPAAATKKVLSYQERLEMERKEAEEKAAQRRREAEERLKKIKQTLPAAAAPAPVRSTMPLTKPVTPKFSTLHTRPVRPAPTVTAATKASTNIRSLGAPAVPKAVVPRPVAPKVIAKPPLTRPIAPKFHTVTRPARTAEQGPAAAPAAADKASSNRIAAKHVVTAKPAFSRPAVSIPKPEPPKGPTVPQSPKLTSRVRSRPVGVLSAAEREKLEVEEMKKHQFKASKVDPAILYGKANGGIVGVPAKTKKPVTQPKEFNLHLKERESKWQQKEKPAEGNTVEDQMGGSGAVPVFKANPVPETLHRPAPLPAKPAKPVTVPKSPKFHPLTERTRVVQPPPEPPKIKAKPIPASLFQPFKPTIAPHKPVEPKLFPGLAEHLKDFEERLAKAKQKTQELLRKREERLPFKANPLPPTTHVPVVPPKVSIPVTQPEEFDLLTEKRGAVYVERWQQTLARLEEEARALREFKANTEIEKVLRPPPPLEKPNRPLTEAHDVVLHSQLRATERAEFDRRFQAAERAKAEQKAQEEARKLHEEIRELRRQLVHKAQPIMGRAPPNPPHPSNVSLTEPNTPHFAKPKSRFQVR